MDFYPIDPNAVVSYKGKSNILSSRTFTIQELINRLRGSVGVTIEPWLTEGIPCEILRPGFDWQKGRLKITIEFCQDNSVAIDE